MKIVRRVVYIVAVLPILTLLTAYLFGFLYWAILSIFFPDPGGSLFVSIDLNLAIFVFGLGMAYVFWIFFAARFTHRKYDYLLAVPFVTFGIWWQVKFGLFQIVPLVIYALLGFYFGVLARKWTEKILKRKINP